MDQQYGYNFEIIEVPFDSVIAGIAAGKYDMAAASLKDISSATVFSSRNRSGDIFTPYSSSSMMKRAKPIIDPQPGTERKSSSGETAGASSMLATLSRKSFTSNSGITFS